MIKDICPYCDKITLLEKIQGNEIVEVRGETVRVSSEFLRCTICNGAFDDPKSKNDILDTAYREYRRRHGMLQPEEIHQLRKHYGLTQKELAGLLSWGEVTLSRYEQGKLQDSSHNVMLDFIRDPFNMLKRVLESNDIFLPEKKQQLIEKLNLLIEKEGILKKWYQQGFGNYEPDFYSGLQKLNIEKILSMIQFFCYPKGQFKTKLCKLSYYADAFHYKSHGKSISGSRYIKMPYGPVPLHYEHYNAFLIEDKKLQIHETIKGEIVEERLISHTGPDLSSFSDEEIRTLHKIKVFFDNYSCKKISDISHQEEGYIKTTERNFISYEYAKNLKYPIDN